MNCVVKRLQYISYFSFQGIFRQSLIQINGYLCLLAEVDSIRQIKYSSSNPEHEKQLMQVKGSTIKHLLWFSSIITPAFQSLNQPLNFNEHQENMSV